MDTTYKTIQKLIIIAAALALSIVLTNFTSYAHVVIKPNEVTPGAQTLVIRVPNEKDVATVGLRVLVPQGVSVGNIEPVAGWIHNQKIDILPPSDAVPTDDDEPSGERITEISWTGGQIGVGEYQDFSLSVAYNEPENNDKLVWKVYQTYSDGSVVAWDDTDAKYPAPKVTVVKEINTTIVAPAPAESSQALWLSIAAVLMSVAALTISFKKRS